MTDLMNWKERQIQLLMALDEARDTLKDDADPVAMFSVIVALLGKTFAAENVAIYINGYAGQENDTVITQGMVEGLALELCKQAVTFETPGALTGSPFAH